ncbi:TPA: hypothetical protein ACYSC8_004953 [Citrobacter freundii]|mgnify:FL=1|jgi:hypothetical protein|uniref:Uncharacterized protein n=5 Tax=Enterobacteriaceae TaxID=543 RepID=A0A7U5TQ73_ECOLX|nr:MULTISPECIES: hypothetical protein [Enterobacterales]EBV3856704.1 hypothetical protein [Salmonella enterica subsp. enterica serovar Cerro]ECA1963875.1 hypothetical protein [Salmonella enterica subsp. enterica serovar Colindale]HAT7517078.1 hypothetical protein [Kluyvera ascorbata]ACI63033.1 hypothetical protein [Klebsiella pneumoniae]AUY05548.1 hypothetical protein C3F40_28410 [Escherichia coli]
MNHEQIRRDTTAELTHIIKLSLAQWHREGGKSAGPEGPVIAFGKRIMRGGVMMIVGHSIRGHEWATPAYYADVARSLRKDKTGKVYASHCQIERETFTCQLFARIMGLTQTAYRGLPDVAPEWQTISENEQRQIVEFISSCMA